MLVGVGWCVKNWGVMDDDHDDKHHQGYISRYLLQTHVVVAGALLTKSRRSCLVVAVPSWACLVLASSGVHHLEMEVLGRRRRWFRRCGGACYSGSSTKSDIVVEKLCLWRQL